MKNVNKNCLFLEGELANECHPQSHLDLDSLFLAAQQWRLLKK